MNFNAICILGLVVSIPFGAAFILAPEAVAAMYGIDALTPGSAHIARLLGIELLFMSAAFLAIRGTADGQLQRRFATLFAAASALATAIALQAVTSGAVNAMGWTTVLIYGFFAAAWAWLALRRAGMGATRLSA